VHVHVRLCVCMCVRARACTCVCMYIYIYIYENLHMHNISADRAQKSTHAHKWSVMVNASMNICVHVYACIHV